MTRQYARRLVDKAIVEGQVPRVHPNGFIQLDLDGQRRLHVWPDDNRIPRQSVATTIHDHRFDMQSTVITGVIAQEWYVVQIDPSMPFTHEVHVAQYVEGRKQSSLEPTGVRVRALLHATQPVGPGKTYKQYRYSFHDTRWGKLLAATVMTKSNEDKSHKPRILVPLGASPDNSFVRANTSEDLLWGYINRALQTS